MLTINTWLILLIAGFITFFLGFYKYENDKAAISYIFSDLFLFICAITSTHLQFVTDTGVQTTDANAIIGVILIPIALIAAVLAFYELSDEATTLAGVNP